MRSQAIILGLALAASMPMKAGAQGAADKRPYNGEIVMTPSGQLVAPWKEIRSCDEKGKCIVVVANPKTREIARYEGRWSSRFELTGNGRQVRRAETALAKAQRLQGLASDPAQ